MNVFIGNIESAILSIEESLSILDTQQPETKTKYSATKTALRDLIYALKLTLKHVDRRNGFFCKWLLSRVWSNPSKNMLFEIKGITTKEHQFWHNNQFFGDKESNHQLFRLCLLQSLEKATTCCLN